MYYNQYKPVFMNRADLEAGVRFAGPRPLEQSGKIYVKDDYLFINEKYKGIHIYDNVNPEEPENIGFLQIDGCIDMAIKGNILYADNAVDLIAIKFNSDYTGISVTERIKNVFPEIMDPDGNGLSYREELARPQNSILVRWDLR